MKKLVLSMAVVAAAIMVSCGNKAENATNNADENVAGEVANPVADGVVIDETLVVTEEEAPSLLDKIKSAASAENVQKGIAYVKQLVASGKLAEARTYLDQIKPYADQVGMTGALSTVSNLLEKADGSIGNAASDVKNEADAAVADAQAKADAAVADAQAKADAAVADAQAKAAAALKGMGM